VTCIAIAASLAPLLATTIFNTSPGDTLTPLVYVASVIAAVRHSQRRASRRAWTANALALRLWETASWTAGPSRLFALFCACAAVAARGIADPTDVVQTCACPVVAGRWRPRATSR
jgi:hypothetical protein